MKKKEINVKEIFLKEGWMTKYHYIMDVMNSCKTQMQMRNAWHWGRKILHRDMDVIIDKYDINYYQAISLTDDYMDTLRNIFLTFEGETE